VTNDTSLDLLGVQVWLPAMREVLLSAPSGWTPPGPPGLWRWVPGVKTVGGRDL